MTGAPSARGTIDGPQGSSHEGKKALLSSSLLIIDRAQVKGIFSSANDEAALARKTGKAEEAGCGDPLSDGTHGTTTWAPGRGVADEALRSNAALPPCGWAVSCWLLVVTELSQTRHIGTGKPLLGNVRY